MTVELQLSFLCSEPVAKGKRPLLLKGGRNQRIFFQETNKTDGATCVTFDLGKHFFIFFSKKNYRMKEGKGGYPRQRTRSVEEGESGNNMASRVQDVAEDFG